MQCLILRVLAVPVLWGRPICTYCLYHPAARQHITSDAHSGRDCHDIARCVIEIILGVDGITKLLVTGGER